VDSGLPLPEAGQASTVFSLTALFGAYLGIHLLLGLPALLGLAAGTILALFLIRDWIEKGGAKTFDDFLFDFLGGSRSNSVVFALGISAIQCAYATSELAILRDVADVSLGVRSKHSTLLVVALGVIAYFYVLFGGYMAVFRTDVLQFMLVAAMGIVIFALTAHQGPARNWTSVLLPRPGYWELHSWGSSGPLLYVYHFLIGAVMGLGFLVASPDAWKRVFLVSSARQARGTRFAIFAAVGTAPFLVLIPIGMASSPVPDGPVSVGAMWNGVLGSNALFVATALGLIASFLSAFNGALLASVHVGLVAKRRLRRTRTERARFHWLMVSTLLTIFFMFVAMLSFDNPYILANLLLGPYAVAAGVLVATRGKIQRMPDRSLLWILVIGFAAWFIYFLSTVGLPAVPTTYQINTVPGGVLLFGLTVLACRLLMFGGARGARFSDN
jgi:Na+/proline symporter